MSSAPSPKEIADDARWLAQALDPSEGAVRLIAMDRDSYRAASFLDDRMLQQPVDTHVVPWPLIEEATAAELRSDARWIFHIGHVGSTLVSRLLGEIDGVLSIREPRILRDVALAPEGMHNRYVQPIPKLMSRTFGAHETACVKATSFVSEIAPELVPRGERALFMYATPRNYIASILAGENSIQELRMLAPTRAQRLARRVSAIGPAHGDGEMAAVAWACEMTALEAASDAMADRLVEWTDFDLMLEDMPRALAGVANSFGFDFVRAPEIANGPLMRRYSKAMEYDYTPDLRRDLIAEAATHLRADVEAGLAMLHRAAEKSPLLARAVARTSEA